MINAVAKTNCLIEIQALAYNQGHFNSIIWPRAKQCTGDPTYTTTRMNKNENGR